MFKSSQQSGYSLVEVLVAISILLIATVGPMTIASRAQQSARYAREQNFAFFLAQEGLEQVVNLRNEYGLKHVKDPNIESDAWMATVGSCFSANGCDLTFIATDSSVNVNACNGSNGCPIRYSPNFSGAPFTSYTYPGDGSSATPYTRAIILENVTGGVKATSLVKWTPTIYGTEKTIELETYLYDIYDL